MRPRCERHQLALSPAGNCVLCRRETGAAAGAGGSAAKDASASDTTAIATETHAAPRPVAIAQGSRQLNIAISPALLLLPLAALAVYWVRTDARMRTPAAEQLVEAPPPVTPVDNETQPTTPPDFEVRFEGPEGSHTEPSAAKPGDIDPAQEQRRQQRQQAEELAAARERVSVNVYYTTWCPACRSVRAYLRDRGIRSTEYDIERDPRARARQRRLNPRGSIPTLDIEGQVLVGFSASKIEHAIDQAARARIERDR